MSIVQRSQIISASMAPTWSAISSMKAVQDWHPNVARAHVLTPQDTGVGASRRVEFQDGNTVVETVVDESELQFVTMEMTELPMLKDAKVTIRTEERDPETTEVTFSLDYGMKLGPLGWLLDVVVMRRLFFKVFGVALDGLAYHLETGELVADSIPDRG